MNSYSLLTLLKVRERNKSLSESLLLEARYVLDIERKKLSQINEHLIKKRQARAAMQNSFFSRSQNKPSNQREVLCLALIAQKNLSDETSIKQSLLSQAELVSKAELKKSAATKIAMEAQRDLKAINKHHAFWQHRELKHEELKLEYDNDDQNSTRFWLKKRA